MTSGVSVREGGGEIQPQSLASREDRMAVMSTASVRADGVFRCLSFCVNTWIRFGLAIVLLHFMCGSTSPATDGDPAPADIRSTAFEIICKAFPPRRGAFRVLYERHMLPPAAQMSPPESVVEVDEPQRSVAVFAFERADNHVYFFGGSPVRTGDGRGALSLHEWIQKGDDHFSMSHLIIGASLGENGEIDEASQSSLKVARLPPIIWQKDAEKARSRLNALSAGATFLGWFMSDDRRIDLAEVDPGEDLSFTKVIDGYDVVHIASGLTFRLRNGRVAKWEYRMGSAGDTKIIVCTPETFDSEGSIGSFRIQGNNSPDFTVVRLLEFDEGFGQIGFRVLPVSVGHPIISLENRNLRLAWHEGAVATVIDPAGEARILSNLRSDNEFHVEAESSKSPPVLRQTHLGEMGSSKQCGVYAFAYAASTLGKRVPLLELVSERYMTSEFGSSARDLELAAEDYGLSSFAVANSSPYLLRVHDGPAILHFRNLAGIGGHWVVFEGFNDRGEMLICDLPDETSAYPVADVLTYWDGNAVLLSKEGIKPWALPVARLMQSWPVLGIAVLFSGIGWLASRVGPNCRRSRTLIVLAAIGIFGLCWTSFSSLGYLRNPEAVLLTLGHDAFGSRGKIKVVDELPPHVNLIDARLTSDFQREHIPGSLNIPVDSRLAHLHRLVTDIDLAEPIAVYCNNARCDWADKVALKLSSIGYTDVSIYRPGFQGYKALHDE